MRCHGLRGPRGAVNECAPRRVAGRCARCLAALRVGTATCVHERGRGRSRMLHGASAVGCAIGLGQPPVGARCVARGWTPIVAERMGCDRACGWHACMLTHRRPHAGSHAPQGTAQPPHAHARAPPWCATRAAHLPAGGDRLHNRVQQRNAGNNQRPCMLRCLAARRAAPRSPQRH